MEEDRGGKWISPRLAEIMRRDGKEGRAKRGGGGEGRRKGPIPAWRDNLPREFQERNTLIGTKWNKPTNINSATPSGEEGPFDTDYLTLPPSSWDAREEGFLRVPLPRKTHLVRLSRPTLSTGWNIEAREDAPRDRFWRFYLIDGLAAVWYRFIRFISEHWFPCAKFFEKSLYYLDN